MLLDIWQKVVGLGIPVGTPKTAFFEAFPPSLVSSPKGMSSSMDSWQSGLKILICCFRYEKLSLIDWLVRFPLANLQK